MVELKNSKLEWFYLDKIMYLCYNFTQEAGESYFMFFILNRSIIF